MRHGDGREVVNAVFGVVVSFGEPIAVAEHNGASENIERGSDLELVFVIVFGLIDASLQAERKDLTILLEKPPSTQQRYIAKQCNTLSTCQGGDVRHGPWVQTH